jgi:hypothetical protein
VIRYAFGGVLFVCLCLSVGVWWLAHVNSGLTAENDRLSASVEALRVSAAQSAAAHAVAAALAETQRQRAIVLQGQIENVLVTKYGGCADALIDPNLLSDIGGVRTSH